MIYDLEDEEREWSGGPVLPRSPRKSPVRCRGGRFCAKNSDRQTRRRGMVAVWASAPENAVSGARGVCMWHVAVWILGAKTRVSSAGPSAGLLVQTKPIWPARAGPGGVGAGQPGGPRYPSVPPFQHSTIPVLRRGRRDGKVERKSPGRLPWGAAVARLSIAPYHGGLSAARMRVVMLADAAGVAGEDCHFSLMPPVPLPIIRLMTRALSD
jgi:hypothetical protein